ncbi:MAG: serine hydrolase, partial [Bacillota bacterium]|nr:serine hydrolase [Bacillota bacterium]
EAGVQSKGILRFLERLEEEHLHVHSFILTRHDLVIAEGAYAPYTLTEPHMLFSLSKSFTSTAIGFAVQEGLLTVQDRLLDYFEGKLPSRPCVNMEKITIKHLLTMNTGHVIEPDIFQDDKDWVYEFLTSYVALEPGSHFLYNTAATFMLSAIIHKVTGQSVFDYLKPRLFEPLGFSKDIWWEASPEGISTGGFGLNITTEDIAKFGSLLLHKGTYNGQQLLNAQWFEEAATPWSDNSVNGPGDWGQGYGYQFWMCIPDKVYRGDGAFGQYCVIMPEQDMVLAANSGLSDMGRILTAFWEEVLPSVTESSENIVKNDEHQAKLEEKLSSLTLEGYYEEKVADCNELTIPEYILGKKYEASPNPYNITKVAFEKAKQSKENYRLSFEIGGNWNTVELSKHCWTAASLDLSSEEVVTRQKRWSKHYGLFENIAVKGCTQNNTLYMDMAFVNTTFQDTWEIRFQDGGFTAHVKRNVSFVGVDFQFFGREYKSN